MSSPDFHVEDHGSVVLLRPMTKAACRWLDEHTDTEGYAWIGGALAVEPRYIGDIVDGAQGDGFTVE